MITLIKKDIRLFRVPVVALMILSFGAVIQPFAMYWFTDGPGRNWLPEIRLGYTLQTSARLGLLTLVAMAASFGGSAFATERREGWLDFVAVLPVRRHIIVMSKLIASVPIIAFIFFVWAATNSVGYRMCSAERAVINDEGKFLVTFASAIFMSYSISWAISSAGRSAAIAAGVAIGLVAAIYIWAMNYYASATTAIDPRIMFVNMATVIIGLAAVVGSSIRYCYRTAP